MLALLAAAGLALAARGGAAVPEPAPADGDVVLRGGSLFDPVAGTVRPNAGILVRRGRFMVVGAAVDAAAAARVVELDAEDTILPGLLDLHGHYDVDLLGRGRVDDTKVNPVVYLANGVTTTFTAGEFDPGRIRELKRRIDAGEAVGPRILTAGHKFGVAWPGWDAASTPAEVRGMVDRAVAAGVHGFKAYGLEPAQLEALIERAHRHGRTVTAHLMGRDRINPRDAVLMGIDRIEHYLGGDAFAAGRTAYESLPALDPSSASHREVIELYLRHRVYYDPTITRFVYLGNRGVAGAERDSVLDYWYDERALFTPYVQELVRAREVAVAAPGWRAVPDVKRRDVKAFYDAGGGDLITLGTDNPSVGEYLPGFDAHRELENFVRAGIPPAAALRFATLNGARALNVDEALGSIEVGKLADLFVVRGDPLEDIRRTRAIRLVMKAGELYDPAALLASVEGRLGPAGAHEADRW